MSGDSSPLPRVPETTAEELSRHYRAVLGEQAWEVDVPEAVGPAVPAPPAEPDLAPLSPLRIIEAFLFIGGPPLSAARAAEAVRGLTPVQFQEAVAALNLDYRRQGRPYAIQCRDQGYVLALRPRFQKVAEQLHGSAREARLSPAAIDVLSLAAYRQPATKKGIDSIRGAESGAILRLLVRHGLIAVVNRPDAAPREVAYGTTPRFLELFGLRSLEDLPQTQDLQQL